MHIDVFKTSNQLLTLNKHDEVGPQTCKAQRWPFAFKSKNREEAGKVVASHALPALHRQAVARDPHYAANILCFDACYHLPFTACIKGQPFAS